MLDISWTEFLLIGVVALIVIGPKELPAVLRTVGQWTRKARTMAADFQNQFQEAMREAEMADLKKQVDEVAQDIKHFDPLKDVRTEFEAAGKDLQATLSQPHGEDRPAEPAPAAPASAESPAPAPALPEPAPPAGDLPLPEAVQELRDKDIVGAATGPVAPQPAEKVAQPETTERTG